MSVDGSPIPTWADLSGYYDTAGGGHIQFHCNFPNHAAGVVARLGCEPTRESVQQAVLQHDPYVLEQQLIDDGMIAARVRTMDEWAEHPHAIATNDLPLITIERLGDAAPRNPERRLKVLDCSRVLAGPVAGLTFAAHGADVLLVGAEHLPSLEAGVLVTGFGKRNAFVDLDTEVGCAGPTLLEMQTFDRRSSGAFAARARRGAVRTGTAACSCAFDWVGPWAGRRGRLVVQSTTGIVAAGSAASGRAQAPLPVQALDFSTGLLAALRLPNSCAREYGGTGWRARSARNGSHLVRSQSSSPACDPPSSAMHTVATPSGDVTAALPIGGSWPWGPQPLGSADPIWL